MLDRNAGGGDMSTSHSSRLSVTGFIGEEAAALAPAQSANDDIFCIGWYLRLCLLLFDSA